MALTARHARSAGAAEARRRARCLLHGAYWRSPTFSGHRSGRGGFARRAAELDPAQTARLLPNRRRKPLGWRTGRGASGHGARPALAASLPWWDAIRIGRPRATPMPGAPATAMPATRATSSGHRRAHGRAAVSGASTTRQLWPACWSAATRLVRGAAMLPRPRESTRPAMACARRGDCARARTLLTARWAGCAPWRPLR